MSHCMDAEIIVYRSLKFVSNFEVVAPYNEKQIASWSEKYTGQLCKSGIASPVDTDLT